MRRARLTYKGAYHHVMNRGIKGENIFGDKRAKAYFLSILDEKSEKQRIRIFGYCIMRNHYHIVLQNSSGKLSEFMKQLNGQYGIYYRKRMGGKGYVFQGRFESTLIQDDRYMEMAILYVLLNPVRKGIVRDPWNYEWSSIRQYFARTKPSFIDTELVEELFKEKRILKHLLVEWAGRDLPVKKTRAGYVLGEDSFIEKAIRKFDRRKKEEGSKRRRRHEYELESAEKVIEDFEKNIGSKIEGIDVESRKGRVLRNELLVLLKDRAGLRYSEIIQYPLFQNLKYSSLGQLYKRIKEEEKR